MGKDTQITITGLPGVIYNGVPDWLYQGEFQLHNPRVTSVTEGRWNLQKIRIENVGFSPFSEVSGTNTFQVKRQNIKYSTHLKELINSVFYVSSYYIGYIKVYDKYKFKSRGTYGVLEP